MLTSELFRDTTRKIEREPMRILLFNPDNGVTRNFMPHLWMFLLKSLTPPEHEVLLIDGNAQRMDEDEIARYVRDQKIDLVGIGAMTRMIQKAYRMADAIRAAGVPVVMGGPHVTEVPDEALGRDGGPQHADAVALGEADETWPRSLSVYSVGVDGSGSIQHGSSSARSAAQARVQRLGKLPADTRGVGTRMPIRLRILHCDRFLWRLDQVSFKRECCRRTASLEGAVPKRAWSDCGLLHR